MLVYGGIIGSFNNAKKQVSLLIFTMWSSIYIFVLDFRLRFPYAAIAELAFGRYVGYLVTILLDISIFSAAIPMIVMAAQNMELVVDKISDGSYEFSYCYWAIILGVFICPFMWLASPKYMK